MDFNEKMGMKIIHTSDLHIGKVLYGEEMTDNHLAFFDQLVRLVEAERPEALLIAGDIYENSNPTVAAKGLFNAGLLRIHEAHPAMSIVVISGNHDSASRLGVDASLWNLARVRLVTAVAADEERVADYDAHIIELTDETGAVCALLGAVPFAYEQSFPKAEEDENRITAFYKGLLRRMEERNVRGVPRLLMGHLSVVADLDLTGHRNDVIGGVAMLDVADFSDEFDYFALGHIHHPQFVKGSDRRVRYAGTPLPVSFDEPFPHSVSVVSFDAENRPQVCEHAIEVPHPLVTLPAVPSDFSEALNCLKRYPWRGTEWVRLNVNLLSAPSDAWRQAEDALGDSSAKLLHINYVRPDIDAQSAERKDVTLSEFRELSPLEVARLSYKEEFTEEMEELFNEVLTMLHD